MSRWIEAFAADELASEQARLVKTDDKRIAVFRAGDGCLYAVDDRCPHEGYPLVKGAVANCVLTCKWHNFKFDLRDGSCLMGDEEVRTFPIRVVDGRVEIDVSDPPVEVVAAAIWQRLETALQQRKMGQVAREVVRLLDLGIAPAQLAVFAAGYDARYAEYGATHVLPTAVDVIAEAERRGGVDAALPLMQAFELAAFAHTRRPPRPVAESRDPGPDPQRAGQTLAALVEAEDIAGAEALLRGALARGWQREVIEPWLYRLVCEHFLDFGHAMIYQVKVFDLLDRVGWAHADEVLVGHLAGIVYGTREDTLPEFAHAEKVWARVAPECEAVYAAAGDAPVDVAALADTFAHGDRDSALDAVAATLRAGGSLVAVVDALSLAACERLLRFDVTIDADPAVQNSWLDVTHTLTFANALRHAVQRYRDPRIVRALLFGARFVNVMRVLDAAEPSGVPAEPIGDVEAFARAAWDTVLDDPVTRPIVAVHLVKVLVAALEEQRAIGSTQPLRAFQRLLAAPIRERNIARATHEAIRLVKHGKVPRTLF